MTVHVYWFKPAVIQTQCLETTEREATKTLNENTSAADSVFEKLNDKNARFILKQTTLKWTDIYVFNLTFNSYIMV